MKKVVCMLLLITEISVKAVQTCQQLIRGFASVDPVIVNVQRLRKQIYRRLEILGTNSAGNPRCAFPFIPENAIHEF